MSKETKKEENSEVNQREEEVMSIKYYRQPLIH
jgi:hypothetical protein